MPSIFTAKNNFSGFTLIELLVVIAIIGVLSTVVMGSLSNARSKGRDSRRISDIKQLQLALILYHDANGTYPIQLSDLTASGYISNIPKDPRTNVDYLYLPLQGAAINNSICGSYHLAAELENYSTAAGSPFQDDDDINGATGGSYSDTANGPQCNSGSLQTINGIDSASNRIYDMRP